MESPKVKKDDGQAQRKPKRTKESKQSKAPEDEENKSKASLRGIVGENPAKKERKRRTKRSATNGAGQRAAGSQNAAGDQGDNVKRGKKKVKPKVEGSMEIDGFQVNLADFADDFVSIDDTEGKKGDLQEMSPNNQLKSQPTGRLFVEQSGGFKSSDKKKVAEHLWNMEKRKAEASRIADAEYVSTSQATLIFALKSHTIFMTFARFCMGTLAGMALWHCLIMFGQTTGAYNHTDFVDRYRSFSIGVNSGFYILITVCMVSTADRYDIMKINRDFVYRMFTLQSGAIAFILYLIALCLNLAMASTADRLGTTEPNNNSTAGTLLWSSEVESKTIINTWNVLAVIRAVALLLAWLVISLRPNTDRLRKNLQVADISWGSEAESGYVNRHAASIHQI